MMIAGFLASIHVSTFDFQGADKDTIMLMKLPKYPLLAYFDLILPPWDVREAARNCREKGMSERRLSGCSASSLPRLWSPAVWRLMRRLWSICSAPTPNAQKTRPTSFCTVVERKDGVQEAYAYNVLAIAWPEIQSRAAEQQAYKMEQIILFE